VDDRDVGVDRAHCAHLLAGERAVDEGDVLAVLRQVGTRVAAQHGERQVRGAGDVRVGEAGVGVLAQLDWPRPLVLDGVAEAVQRPDAGVAAVGEDHPLDAAEADHLVEEDVGREADDGQVGAALAEQLVPGREGDEVREALERHEAAVLHERRDGFGKRLDLPGLLHALSPPKISFVLRTDVRNKNIT
jgi:hypothetical protein